MHFTKLKYSHFYFVLTLYQRLHFNPEKEGAICREGFVLQSAAYNYNNWIQSRDVASFCATNIGLCRQNTYQYFPSL